MPFVVNVAGLCQGRRQQGQLLAPAPPSDQHNLNLEVD
jgi:hypothetical protein